MWGAGMSAPAHKRFIPDQHTESDKALQLWNPQKVGAPKPEEPTQALWWAADLTTFVGVGR